jgi:hypothetical protein
MRSVIMRRYYNGCPDSALQRVIDENAAHRAAIQSRGFSVTYFPNGEFYQAFDARHLPVTVECRTLAEVSRTLPNQPKEHLT